ncbi:hypothetical protein FISHEDRAFT_68770 [Fistulina hepatica ATCC 64428]|uniref:Uncharacterized protein n=1 Tax=Fistulina hepatica ATCC 64428 TaxID=1128425 RepID=A0A0D7ANW3_9AGAR|nr:hypothetical protein FISHEDRAFT_68770 [Fistulina hepatica ATCC 64428]
MSTLLTVRLFSHLERGNRGFPAADEALYDLFAPHSTYLYSWLKLSTLMQAFLIALFEEVEKAIAEHAPNSEDLPSWFRQYMTKGQTFDSQGQKRKSLYEAIAKGTTSLLDSTNAGASTVEYHLRLLAAAAKLLEHFKSDEPDESSHPHVILAFDEAHTLTRDVEEYKPEGSSSSAPLSHLRMALRSLRPFRIFSVFLSTTGKIAQVSGPKEFDLSAPAFTTLGWDQLARPLPVKSKGVSCADIGFDYQVHLGRPMFGARYDVLLEAVKASWAPKSRETGVPSNFMMFVEEKLSGWAGIKEFPAAVKFAVLSQRFPLEFKVHNEAEMEQVHRNLRVCVSMDKSFVSMVTTASSEPLLSEAASHLMRRENFNAPAALLEVMREGSIHTGDCNELIVLLLLTLARDEVASRQVECGAFFGVVPFLKALFVSRSEEPSSDTDDDIDVYPVSPSEELSPDIEDVLEAHPSVYRAEHEKDIPLKDAFENTSMHFNHFLKRGEPNGLDFACIVGFLARNAAVMCPKSQPGINGAIPMVSGPTILRTKTGLFLFRVKIDDEEEEYAVPDVKLFTTMDPRSFGFEDLDVPVIRVVFSLGGRRPALRVVPQSSEPGEFTSYDIWASGLFKGVFCACKDYRSPWRDLLAVSSGWKSIYSEKDSPQRELQMQTTPMAGKDDAFWQWIGPAWKTH